MDFQKLKSDRQFLGNMKDLPINEFPPEIMVQIMALGGNKMMRVNRYHLNLFNKHTSFILKSIYNKKSLAEKVMYAVKKGLSLKMIIRIEIDAWMGYAIIMFADPFIYVDEYIKTRLASYILMIAIKYDRKDMVEHLLFNPCIDKGYALIYAVKYARLEIASLLLVMGADIHINNDAALRVAIYYECTQMIDLLLDFGKQDYSDPDYIINSPCHGHVQTCTLFAPEWIRDVRRRRRNTLLPIRAKDWGGDWSGVNLDDGIVGSGSAMGIFLTL